MNIFSNVLTNVLASLYSEFFLSLLLAFLFMYFYYYAKQYGGWKKAFLNFISTLYRNPYDRRVFYFAFYLAMILCRTVLGRSLWINPLNDVLGSWSIYGSDGQLHTEGIENIILFVPFTYLYFFLIESKKDGILTKRLILFRSVEYSFLFSLCIEFIQLFFKLGAFQLSDLAYNTLGGFIGGVCFMLIFSWKKKKTK